MKHKHGKRSSKEQLGFLQKPKGSRSYCIVDKNSDKNLKIGRAELQKALPGDLVPRKQYEEFYWETTAKRENFFLVSDWS